MLTHCVNLLDLRGTAESTCCRRSTAHISASNKVVKARDEMRCARIVLHVLLLGSTCQAVSPQRSSGAGADLRSSSSPKDKTPTHAAHSTRLFGVDLHHGVPTTRPPHPSHAHSTRLFGVTMTPGHEGTSSTHPRHPTQTSQTTHTHPAHQSHVSQAHGTHTGSKEPPHSLAQTKQPVPLGHLAAEFHPVRYSRNANRRKNRQKSGSQAAGKTPQSDKRKGKGWSKGDKWWNRVGGRPQSQRAPDGQGLRALKKQVGRQQIEKSLDEHPSKKHQSPKGGGPGSPGAGSHAVSKRSADSYISPRGSSAGSGSESPSSSRSKGKRPAHETHSTRLFGVNVTPGKPSSPAHTSHAKPAHTPTQAHGPQLGSKAPTHSPAQTKEPGRLGHLVANLQPVRYAYVPKGTPRGRPKGSKTGETSRQAGKAPQALAPKPQRGDSNPGRVWWKKQGGRPRAQRVEAGSGPRYEELKKIREMKKLKKAGKSLDEHPSGHHHHPHGGPGSPGAGSHAVSKRGTQDALTLESHDTLINPRGGGSESRSPSPNEDAPGHQIHSTRLFGVTVTPGRKPASPAHFDQSTPAHTAHPGQSSQVQAARPHDGRPSQSRKPGQLSHLVANLRPVRSAKTQPTSIKLMGSKITTIPQRASKAPAKIGPKRKVGAPGGQWWKKAGGKPRSQRLPDSYHALAMRRMREKKKLAEMQKSLDEHPSGHHQHPPGGPSSPGAGAGSQAVSKRHADAVLVPRGSGSEPKTPSPARSHEQAPAHEDHSVRLFGVTMAPGRPVSASDSSHLPAVHPSQSTAPHATHQDNAGSSRSHPQGKLLSRLGHLAAEFQPVRFTRKTKINQPKSTTASQEVGQGPQTAAGKPKRGSPGGHWWAKAGGRPASQRVPNGLGPKAQSKYKQQLKLKGPGKFPDEHPSKGQHPRKGGGPGSPGAGSHAVSKRDTADTLTARGSGSGSKPSSPSRSGEKALADQSHSVRLFGVNVTPGKPHLPMRSGQSSHTHPTTESYAAHRDNAQTSHNPPNSNQAGRLGHLLTDLHPVRTTRVSSGRGRGRPPGSKNTGIAKVRNKNPLTADGKPKRGPPGGQWWKIAGRKPYSQRLPHGTEPVAQQHLGQKQTTQETGRLLTEHSSGHHHHASKGGGPGSPGGGTHTVSKRSDHRALAPRGSPSRSQSPAPSPAHSSERAPVTATAPVRLFGVDVAPGRPASPMHSSQSTDAGAAHPVSGPSRSQTSSKGIGQLGHLVADFHPVRTSRPFTGRPPGRPKGSKTRQPGIDTQPPKPKSAKLWKGSKWWNTAGGRPRPRQGAYGTGPQFQAQRKYRQKKKGEVAGKSLDLHPPKHQHHPPGGPGSPNAGSHAISKRSHDAALARRTSSSGSKSSSHSASASTKKEKDPAHATSSFRLFGVNVTPGKPASPAQSKQKVGSHAGHELASSSPSNPKARTAGQLGHLVASLHPIRVDTRPPSDPKKPPGRPKGWVKSLDKSKVAQTVGPKPARPAKGSHWWNTAGGRPGPPQATYGTSRRYESRMKYARKVKMLKQMGKSLDQHPDKHQQHPPGGPGSPGAGSHAVSKRSDRRALAPRGSPSRPTSPSRSGSKEKSPAHAAHDTHAVRLFGVNINQGAKPAVESHHSQPASSSAANPSGAGLSQTKEPGNLGHLVAGMRPAGQKVPKRKGRTRKQSEEGTGSKTGEQQGKRIPASGRGSGNHDNHRRGQWWKHAGGTPRVSPGQGRYFQAQKTYRDRKKLKGEGKSVDEHPGPQRHRPKDDGPGSPGAGSHAVSKRGVDGDILPRSGSASHSRSPSPSASKDKGRTQDAHSTRLFGVNIHEGGGKSPPRHDTHSTRLFGVNIAPGKPSSPPQSSHSALPHHAVHPTRSTQSHPERASGSDAKEPGRLGHLVAGIRPVRWKPQYTPTGKPPGRPRKSESGSAPQKVTQASDRPTKSSKYGSWWKKAGGRPPSERFPDGAGPRAEAQRRYREKQKLKKLANNVKDHPSAHGKHPPGGPGSPGAGGHAVSKRRIEHAQY